MNEGGLDELKTELRTQLRRFFNKKPEPLNVDRDEVDRSLLNKLVHDVKKQRRLPGAPQERTAIHVGWLGESLLPNGWRMRKTTGRLLLRKRTMYRPHRLPTLAGPSLVHSR